jgi:hypothetical protein
VITPVAELITARNRPFIFATGYGSSGLPRISRPPCTAEAFSWKRWPRSYRHDEERAGLVAA